MPHLIEPPPTTSNSPNPPPPNCPYAVAAASAFLKAWENGATLDELITKAAELSWLGKRWVQYTLMMRHPHLHNR